MTQKEKKMAAAMAAVATYLQLEQQTAHEAAAASAAAPAPTVLFNPWGQSGRQATMQLRNLMQMKAFNRLR